MTLDIAVGKSKRVGMFMGDEKVALAVRLVYPPDRICISTSLGVMHKMVVK